MFSPKREATTVLVGITSNEIESDLHGPVESSALLSRRASPLPIKIPYSLFPYYPPTTPFRLLFGATVVCMHACMYVHMYMAWLLYRLALSPA